jgi:hypothetical protein
MRFVADASAETNTAPTVIGMDNETTGASAETQGIPNEHATPDCQAAQVREKPRTEPDVKTTAERAEARSKNNHVKADATAPAKLAALWHETVGNAPQVDYAAVETFSVDDLAFPKTGRGIGTAYVPFWMCRTFDPKKVQEWLESCRFRPFIDLGIKFDAVDAAAGFIYSKEDLIRTYCKNPVELKSGDHRQIYWPNEECLDYLPVYAINPGCHGYACSQFEYFIHRAALIPEIREIVLSPITSRTWSVRVMKRLIAGRHFE